MLNIFIKQRDTKNYRKTGCTTNLNFIKISPQQYIVNLCHKRGIYIDLNLSEHQIQIIIQLLFLSLITTTQFQLLSRREDAAERKILLDPKNSTDIFELGGHHRWCYIFYYSWSVSVWNIAYNKIIKTLYTLCQTA